MESIFTSLIEQTPCQGWRVVIVYSCIFISLINGRISSWSRIMFHVFKLLVRFLIKLTPDLTVACVFITLVELKLGL